MVRHYSTQYPQAQVEVLVSAPAGNSIRKTKDGKIITAAVAKQIFELYIVGNRKMGVPPLTNVHVRISEYPSPVTAAYEALKTFYPGTTVILGASKKDDDWKRWQSAIPWAEKEGLGLNIEDPYTSAVEVVASDEGRVYSASNIRDNFENFDAIRPDIPDHVNPAHIKEIFDEIIPGEA